jgi:hypothetical protein
MLVLLFVIILLNAIHVLNGFLAGSFVLVRKRTNKFKNNINLIRWRISPMSSESMSQNTVSMVDFFADGSVEREIHRTLASCGYKHFMHESKDARDPLAVKFEALNANSAGRKPATIGEIDRLVSGDAASFR